MNIQTVTVVGVTGTMGENAAGFLLRLELKKFIACAEIWRRSRGQFRES